MKNRVLNGLVVVLLGTLLGCEEEKKAEPAAPAEPAVSALKAAESTPAPADSAEADEEQGRPEKIEMDLTDERKAKLLKAYPDAKGFVIAKDIEDQLKKNKAVKEEKNAVKAFDAKAKGKWVLFTGTMVNLTDKGFDMAIVYTPQLPNDPMGMSRQFFTVTFSDVEGYDPSKFKVGSQGVVLAKYNGDQKATPAHEVVETGQWQ